MSFSKDVFFKGMTPVIHSVRFPEGADSTIYTTEAGGRDWMCLWVDKALVNKDKKP